MVAPPKDMRRPDLIVPYMEPPAGSGDQADMGSTLASTLPMAAMFTRNKFIGWASLVFATQQWLGESEESKKKSGTPGIFGVGMSLMAVAVQYLPLFIPPTNRAKTA